MKSKPVVIRHILIVERMPYGFLLHAKPQQLGQTHILQVWMDVGSIYGQRGQASTNLRALSGYFWHRCLIDGGLEDPDLQETFLLAELCPHVRGNAAQDILPDARFRRGADTQAIGPLDQLLQQPPSSRKKEKQGLSREEFYRRTHRLLLPRFRRGQGQAYDQLRAELFDSSVRGALVKTPAAGLEEVLKRWQELQRRIGRRSGRPLLKTALDVLSYESRAAVRRCYAAVWNDLIPALARKHKLGSESLRFMQLMHLEHPMWPRDGGGPWVSVFHGHIFALHPAVSVLMRTSTGQQIIGEYLQAQTPEESVVPYQKLLRAIYLSLCHYSNRREETRRRKL